MLSIGGSKAWPDRKTLEKFGALNCNVARPDRIVDHVIEQAMDYGPVGLESDMWLAMRKEIESGVHALKR